jgi:hypothetical protein
VSGCSNAWRLNCARSCVCSPSGVAWTGWPRTGKYSDISIFGIAASGAGCAIVAATGAPQCWSPDGPAITNPSSRLYTNQAVSVVSASRTTCVLFSDNSVRCFGDSPSNTGRQIPPVGLRAKMLSISSSHACAINMTDCKEALPLLPRLISHFVVQQSSVGVLRMIRKAEIRWFPLGSRSWLSDLSSAPFRKETSPPLALVQVTSAR